jgi:CDP-diacylglycerol---serine O-phosphatidyltransferase
MVFDMLDGHTARLTKQMTKLGAELDSMCDVITFGVAPSFIMLMYRGLYNNPLDNLYHPRLWWGIGVLYTLCAVMRLARFNVETGEEDSHDSFSGLPSPAAAGTLVSFAVVLPSLNRLAASDTRWAKETADVLLAAGQIVLPLLTLAVAWLMVSRIRYPHLFNQLFRGRRNYRHVVQLAAASLAVILMHELAVPLIFTWFVLASPLRAAWGRMSAGRAGVTPAIVPAPEVSPPASQDIPHS